MNWHQIWVAFGLASSIWAANALEIVSLSPQGEVAQVQQIQVKFDKSAVPLGDPKAPAPVTVHCANAVTPAGTGRWLDDRAWVYDFHKALPPGLRCHIQTKLGFKSPQGENLSGTTRYHFSTGGPSVQDIQPQEWQPIEEEQFFILRLNGPASLSSIQNKVWCKASDLGEKIPVRLLNASERQTLLHHQGLTQAAQASPLSIVTLACNRRLSPSAKVQLVFGKGVSTPDTAQGAGVPNAMEQRFDFEVREPFKASFSCERENANAACLPIRPMTLSFNAPVSVKLLRGIHLTHGSHKIPAMVEANKDPEAVAESVQFAQPLPEQTALMLTLPKGFQDAAGRSLHNADSFPMKTATAGMPPLAKFAASPFGVVERLAEPDGTAMLPVTLRHVETPLPVKSLSSSASKVSTLRADKDADIVAWFRKVHSYDRSWISRQQARKDSTAPLPEPVTDEDKRMVETRMVSLLQGHANAKVLNLPQAAAQNPRPFEVVGIPLAPGFHVLEIASQKLGQSLLDERHGPQRTVYVRTSALVTNLGVHFKLGRDNALAWVTTLDKGLPVAGAKVAVSDCRGKAVAQGVTNAQGLLMLEGISPQAPVCGRGSDDGEYQQAYFVSARATQALPNGQGMVEDLAFTWSDWNRGIESWRFGLPTSHAAQPPQVAHTVFDRTLLRAGETVSMKHFVREQIRQGFGLPATRPQTLRITHLGSGQQHEQPLSWRPTATGGLSAHSNFAIPVAAKLGAYEVELLGPDGTSLSTGQFRVEEFRLPVLQGHITPQDKKPLVHAQSVPVQVQVNYVAGGPAMNLPVRVSALVRPKSLAFNAFDAFSFSPPRGAQSQTSTQDESETEDESNTQARVVADKLALTLGKTGAGQLTLTGLPTSPQAQELLLEASYADPNGEIQTLRHTQTLWPAAVVAGIKTEGWVSSRQNMKFQALALNLDGQAQAGVALEVKAIARITTSSRKRMIGGFYTYDNQTTIKDLGRVCSGQSDARGLLLCETAIQEAGEIELVVTAKDAQGQLSQAASSVFVTRQGELWFGGQDHDRMDLLPEKKNYQVGDIAKFQVRMPFRFATALVAVEREGVMHTEVVQLNGQDPTIQLKIQEAWGPNVFVSVLALRGRLREVPWYSFFTWGFKAPREWWTSFWYDGREYVAPTAMVDLSKPAFRLGAAEIQVGTQAHQLQVNVKADKESYPVRGKAQVTVTVKLPNGQPAAKAEVTLVAVDQALLELMPNNSWDLLGAMMQRRAWSVDTATAQMEIIGRRHYGRKAVAPGGGGGHSSTRELLDTLLLWEPQLQLDAHGQARITVPLNDALSTFQIVAVADAGSALFGTGKTSIRATQDLQIISGLPPLVREDDRYRAQLTLRNTTQQAMKVVVTPRASLLDLPAQNVDIPAGDAREVSWWVTAPSTLASTRQAAILWEIEARDSLSGARDALKASQRIVPAVPLTVQQASLVQLNGPFTLNVAPPADALPGRGGLRMALQPKLAEGLPGVKNWFAQYPFSCLEQQTSRAVGLRDSKLWQSVAARIPSYLDNDGLANYFPPRDGEAQGGSDTLTAYLLAATHEATSLDPAFALSDSARAPMERGLTAFVEGRLQRQLWSPRGTGKDLDVRKLAAIEALSRYGKAHARMLQSISIAPNVWPTHAIIDWLNILKRMPDVPEHAKRVTEASQVLRARINYQGTQMVFSTEKDDHWWWLMQNGDANTAKLILAVLDDPAWKDDMGRLTHGFIGRQKNGAWQTTTANLWGGLALEKFSAKWESVTVSGTTQAALAGQTATLDWRKVERVPATDTTGSPNAPNPFGTSLVPGQLRHNTLFLPWAKASSPSNTPTSLSVNHQGPGKPWLTLQSVAAVPLKAPFFAGYQIQKTITPVEQANKNLPPNTYTRGDVLRVTLDIRGSADMAWAVVSDPIPGGGTILGSGLGRDSEIAIQGEKNEGDAWPAFEERSFEAFRTYYQFLPKGSVKLSYTLRLNNVGEFAIPPSRVEAMYAPEIFGQTPNAPLKVEAPR